jgi:hypothetical protein
MDHERTVHKEHPQFDFLVTLSSANCEWPSKSDMIFVTWFKCHRQHLTHVPRFLSEILMRAPTIRLFDNPIVHQIYGEKDDIVPTLCVPTLTKKFISDNVPIRPREELDAHPWHHESWNRPKYALNRNCDDFGSLIYPCKSWKTPSDAAATFLKRIVSQQNNLLLKINGVSFTDR